MQPCAYRTAYDIKVPRELHESVTFESLSRSFDVTSQLAKHNTANNTLQKVQLTFITFVFYSRNILAMGLAVDVEAPSVWSGRCLYSYLHSGQ